MSTMSDEKQVCVDELSGIAYTPTGRMVYTDEALMNALRESARSARCCNAAITKTLQDAIRRWGSRETEEQIR